MTGFYERLLVVVGMTVVSAGCSLYSSGPNGKCGDGVCDREETAKSCPGDCCSATWECGNGVCEPGETGETCGVDCMSSEGCGNGTCDANETAANCPADCTAEEATCGNGVCEAGEAVETCPNDCSTVPFFDGACREGDQRDECSLDDDDDGSFHGSGDALIGSSAAIVGDLDGDGLADIVIGAPEDDQGGEGAGAVYILYGRNKYFDSQIPLADADTALVGGRKRDQFGLAVAAAGDVNGDGLADFLVGAPAGDWFEPGQGAVYLIIGRNNRLSGTIDMGSEGFMYGYAVRFVDSQTVGSAGMAVAGVGDVDGDGYDDFVVGAPARTQPDQGSTGAVYLVYGSNVWENEPTELPVWLDDVAAGWVNDVNGTILGIAVAGAGDVNGDGYDDILISSKGVSSSIRSGTVYLVYGRSTRFYGLSNISDADAMFISGEDNNSVFGRSLAGLGDLDLDGYDDLIIGNPDLNGDDVAYLYYGRPDAFNGAQDISSADAIFEGATTGFEGSNISNVGDLNGDGYKDIAIGATYTGVDGVFVFLGGAQRLLGQRQISQANSLFFLEPDEKDTCQNWAGSVVAGGGDTNGDGFDDFLIGAMDNCSGSGPDGYVYLVLGAGF